MRLLQSDYCLTRSTLKPQMIRLSPALFGLDEPSQEYTLANLFPPFPARAFSS